MTFRSKFCSREQSIRREMTRDVVFVVLDRSSARDYKSVQRIDSVWLTRQEADAFVESQRHNLRDPWVYGVPAGGELAEAVREQDEAPTTMPCASCDGAGMVEGALGGEPEASDDALPCRPCNGTGRLT